MHIKKKLHSKKGFTLAELLIVCGIIAILTGISVPIFIAQRHKAVAAVNVANIRSAKVSVLTRFCIDNLNNSKDGDIFFYEYNVDTGKAELISPEGANSLDFVGWEKYYALGRQETETAARHRVCDRIYVYIRMGSNMSVMTQTAPWYDGYEPGTALDGDSPFGA